MLKSLADKHYAAGDVARKPNHYLRTYEALFAPLRNLSLSILELGVHRAASMNIWQEYFPKATLVGLDIGEKPENFPNEPRIHHIRGSQSDPSALEMAAAYGPVDVIIDDAAHMGKHAKASFSYLYTDHLKRNGLYVLEDWGVALTNPKWPDAHVHESPIDDDHAFPSFKYGMVGLVKQLIDEMLLRNLEIGLIHIKPGQVVIEKALPLQSQVDLTAYNR